MQSAPKMKPEQLIHNESSSFPRRYYCIKLAGVSLGTFCLNTSYTVFLFTMTSLHSNSGSMTLAVNYVVQVVTVIFLPPLLMRMIGCKWTLVFCGFAFSIFNAANLTSYHEILILGAMFAGMGSSTMFATMNVVVSDLAVEYAGFSQVAVDIVLKKFFSILHTSYSMAVICGNLVSAVILSSKVQFVPPYPNMSSSQCHCGSQYCKGVEQFTADFNFTPQQTHNHSLLQLDINNLVAASLGFDGLGIVLFLILLNDYKPGVPKSSQNSLQRLLATCRLLHNSNLLLLILFTVNAGLMYSFISGDFTEGFVTCTLGIGDLGLVATCFSTCMCLGTFLVGIVAPYIPRVILFLASVTINIFDLFLMLFWTPDLYSATIFYIMAGIWGTTFAVWLPQLCALYGLVFPNQHQEAYSNQRTWYSLGFVIGFGWSHNLCMSTKIYTMIGLLISGTLGYLMVERRLSKERIGEPELTPLNSASH